MPLDFVMKAVTSGPTKGKRRNLANKSKTPAEAASRRKPVQTKAGAYQFAAAFARPVQCRKPATSFRLDSHFRQNPNVASANGKTGIEQVLRAWRLGEAKKRNIPVFRIFGDQTLRNIVAARPQNEAELLTLPGTGTSIVKNTENKFIV